MDRQQLDAFWGDSDPSESECGFLTVLAYPTAYLGNEPTDALSVSASLAVPWRTLTAAAQTVRGEITAFAGYHDPGVWEVFKGQPDTPRAEWTEQGTVTARGLPALRERVKAQFFQDSDLQTVLNWIGSQVSQPLKLTVQGEVRRHYAVSEGSAWSAIKAALLSWRRLEYVSLELDDYSLYIGPEEQSPFASAPIQATLEHLKNIYSLKASANGASVVVPAYPWLRLGHRVTLKHPVVNGTARITEVVTTIDKRDTITILTAVMI